MTEEVENQETEENADVSATSASSTQETEQESTPQEPTEKVQEDLQRAKEQGVDVEEFEKIRKSLEKANKEAADRRHKLKEWEELNVNPDDVKSLLEEKRQKEIEKAEEEGRYQELIDKMREETRQREEQANQKVQTMQEKINNQVWKERVRSAIKSKDGIDELLESKILQDTKIVEDDDGYKVQVVDEYGTQKVDESGNALSVEDYVESLKDHPTYSYAFKAPSTTGSGAKTSDKATSSGKQAPRKNRSKMSDRDKASYVKEHGIKAFKSLPW